MFRLTLGGIFLALMVLFAACGADGSEGVGPDGDYSVEKFCSGTDRVFVVYFGGRIEGVTVVEDSPTCQQD